jgi:hypothetical protein
LVFEWIRVGWSCHLDDDDDDDDDEVEVAYLIGELEWSEVVRAVAQTLSVLQRMEVRR